MSEVMMSPVTRPTRNTTVGKYLPCDVSTAGFMLSGGGVKMAVEDVDLVPD